jgi:hypothetical protein
MIYLFNMNLALPAGGSIDIHSVMNKSSLKPSEGAANKESQ